MQQVVEERHLLPDDVARRQKLLEESAYDVALQRFRHEAEVFQQMGRGVNLQDKSIQAWMWDWYVKLVPQIDIAIQEALLEEEKIRQRESLIDATYTRL